MNRLALVPALLCALLAACSKGGSGGSSGAPPQTEEEKTFYALGQSIGRSVGVFAMTPRELEVVQKGLSDTVLSKPTDVKLEEYGPKIQELARARSTKKAEAEKKSGAALVEKAAHEAGAQKFPSGLVVKTLKEGAGASPAATDTVKVHYEGTLENGTVFDSSKKRGQPATFPLNQVIPCWTEGVQKMKVGGQAKLTCPSAIAYGDRGAPPTIPGGATLTFDVELIGIEGKGAQSQSAPAKPSAPAASTPAKK